MQLTLQIRHASNSTARPTRPAALLVRGESSALWLREAAAAGLPAGRLSFLPLVSQNDDRAVGALITADDADLFDRLSFGHSALTVPYACRLDRLYLPVDAELVPPLSDAHLAALLPADRSRILVWHPGRGLLGFDREHILSAADLLRTPKIRAIHTRAVEPPDEHDESPNGDSQDPPTSGADAALRSGRDDIGSDANDISGAPRSPDEQSLPALRDAVRNLGQGIRRALEGLRSLVPESLQSGGAVRPPAPSPRLSARRENEIKRLLHMLETDPDRGLRFAISPAGEGSGSRRPPAPPGGSLGEHSSEFDLNGLRQGGGSADVWDIPREYHVQLIRHYRQLAERELRIGRARRAAWIYATLLNDLPSAAQALETGGHHHDAAMVYLEHLDRPLDAAKSLRNGGFYDEALQIYVNRELWLDAGDMLVEIERSDDARDAFLREVERCSQKLDFIAAGEVAESRLHDADQATALYMAGWMRHSHASDCLRSALRVQADHGRHDDAIRIMEQLTGNTVIAADQMSDAVDVISETANDYPDQSVRDSARRHTWRLAASLLKKDPAGGPAAMSSVRRLAPSDRLLQADTHRFQTEYQETFRAARESGTHPKAAIPQITSTGRLKIAPVNSPGISHEADITWNQAIGNGRFIFRYGRMEHMTELIVRHQLTARPHATTRFTATTDVLQLQPRDADRIRGMPLTLRLPDAFSDTAWLQPLPGPSHWCFDPANRDALDAAALTHSIHPDIQFVLDFAPSHNGTMHVLADSEDEGLRLIIIGSDNLIRNTIVLSDIERQLAESPDNDPRSPLIQTRLFVHHKSWSIVVGRYLFRVDGRSMRLVQEFADRPNNVVACPTSMVPRLVFTFDDSVTCVWPGTGNARRVTPGFYGPVAGFTTNGLLILGGRDTGELTSYRQHRGRATMTGRRVPDRPSDIQFVVPGPLPDQFIAISAAGSMELYACPDGP